MWQTWLLRGLGIAFGVVVLVLTSAYPDATRAFIRSSFHVTDEQVVAEIIKWFFVIAIVIIAVVVVSYVIERKGYLTKKVNDSGVSENGIRSSTDITPTREVKENSSTTRTIIHKDYPPVKTDPTYEHLEGQLFWESWRYFPLAKRLGAKNGRNHLCGTKLIVNLHTRRAFQMSSEIGSMILSGKIRYVDRRKTFPSTKVGEWARLKGYEFFDRYPSEEELRSVLSKAKEQPETPLLAENEVMKGVEYYPERNSEVLDELLSEVKSRMIVVGSEFGLLGARETDIARIVRFAEVSFYVLNPDSEALTAAEASGLITRETKPSAITNLKKYCSFKKDLGENGGRLNVYLYKEPPIHSAIVIDPESEHAKIQVEHYFYGVREVRRRPSLIVSKKLQPELFEKYYDSIRLLMRNNPVPYSCDRYLA